MRKGTIFKYELRRLLLAKEYLLLLAATAAFSLSLLRSVVLLGANYTAPFSKQTFATYCGALTPFLFVLLLMMCVRQLKPSERKTEAVIGATPSPPRAFKLIRYGAVACAYLLAAVIPAVICFIFYRLVFDFTAVGGLLWLGVLLLLPSSILLFGLAMFFGDKKAAVVYVLIAAVLIIGIFQIPLPAILDIFGHSAAQQLDAGDLMLTPAFITGRVAFLVVGIVCIFTALLVPNKQYN